MWQPNNVQWWLLLVVPLLIVGAWPPRDDRSLAAKFVNWAVDPANELPILPDQLALGQGDDPDEVHAHDLQVQQDRRALSEGRMDEKAARVESRRRSVQSRHRAADADSAGRGNRRFWSGVWRADRAS